MTRTGAYGGATISAGASINEAIDCSDPASRPVFFAAGRTFAIAEVLAFGKRSGSAARSRFEKDSDSVPSASPASVDSDALEALISDFRYRHDLVSAAECESWLELRGLSYADLHACMSRRLSATVATSAIDAQIDAVLSEDFARDAREFAARVALAIENALPLAPQGEPTQALWPSWNPCFEALQQQLRSQPQRTQWLRRLQRPLTLIEFDCAEFDSLDAANEARLCVAIDAESLGDIAHTHGFACQRHRVRREAIAERWLQALDLANGGQLAPAICEQSRYLLLQPLGQQAPSLNEPEVAARIDSIVLRQYLDPLIDRHVRWAFAVERS